MAVFKVQSSRPADGERLAEFDVCVSDGPLTPGTEFFLYETHHPCRFVVQSVSSHDDFSTLHVSGIVPWENWRRGAIVDTSGPKSARRYIHDE
jgi:hypothetical protein